jgi:hypothetical protein
MMASQLLMADEAALDKNVKNPVVAKQLGGEQADVAKLSIAPKPPKQEPVISNAPPGPKGQIGPAVVTYAQATLDKEILKVGVAEGKLPEKGVEGDLGKGLKGDLEDAGEDAKVDVDRRDVRDARPGEMAAESMPYPMKEGFESSDWWVKWEMYSNGCEWDRTDCKPTEPEGSYSAWPFVYGTGCPRPCIDNYPPGGESWMIYGPFSLVGVTGEAWLEFYLDLQSELSYDYFKYMASIDDTYFYGYGISGSTSGWVDINRDNIQLPALNLKAVPTLGNLIGKPNVWIAFVFKSDSSNNYKGPFVDDVRLGSVPPPNLCSYTPSGWPGPIVVSENSGDHVNDNPVCGTKIYVDFALTDCNDIGTDKTFYVDLCLDCGIGCQDGISCQRFVVDGGLPAGMFAYKNDVEFTVTPGNHNVCLKIDVTYVVDETNENDNCCEKSFTVGVPDIDITTPTPLNFGDVCVGNYLDKIATVKNVGTCVLNVSSTQITGTNASEFSIQSGGGSFSLNPNQTRDITVRFKPTSLGSKTATLRISNDDPDENPKDVDLKGNSGVPDIDITTPTPLNFGDVCVGNYLDKTATVKNVGTCVLNVSSTQITGTDASLFTIQSGGGSFSLNSGQTRDITVRFKPTATGSKTATLRISSDDPDENPKDVSLSGKGIDPVIVVIPSSHNFSINQGIDDFVCKEFIVKNDGLCQLSVTSTTLVGPNASEFLILSGGGSFTLNPGQTRVVTVCFDPSSSGLKSATLRFASNDIDKPQLDVSLTGGPCRDGGVCGDVSGNGTITAYDAALIMQYLVGLIDTFPGCTVTSPVAVSMRDHYVVSIPHLASAPRSRVKLPILIDDASGVTAGGISLRYDAQSLKAIKVTSADLLSDCYLMERINEGEIRIAFVSAAPLKGSGELLYIEFEVVTSTPDSTDITLKEVSLGENIHVAKIDGSIDVLPTRTLLLANYPNPFNPETWIPYRLAEDATVKVSIYDSKGGVVRVIDLGHQPAGNYVHKDRAVYWDGRNNAGEKVASGIYYYQLQAGRFSAIRKLVVQK